MERQILQTLEFQKVFNENPMPDKPTMLNEERAKLRQSLLDEECEELANAKTITDVADAIIDCMYVLIGTAHEYGLSDRLIQLFDEVHKSNMSKVSEDGVIKYREDGKVLKPDTFVAPNFDEILERDYSVYKEMKEEAMKVEIREKILLEQLVLKNIKKRLNPADLDMFNKYLDSEKRLNKVFKVSYLGGGINERYCEVDIYGTTEVVKINWAKIIKKEQQKEAKLAKKASEELNNNEKTESND